MSKQTIECINVNTAVVMQNRQIIGGSNQWLFV